jgi:hypothetical protein
MKQQFLIVYSDKMPEAIPKNKLFLIAPTLTQLLAMAEK